MTEIQAEIEYQCHDGTWRHSDIEPKGCQFESIDAKHRDFLHRCLDEWLNNSGGSGCFYIKNAGFSIDNPDDWTAYWKGLFTND